MDKYIYIYIIISNLKTVTFVSPVAIETKCTSVVERMSCLLEVEFYSLFSYLTAQILIDGKDK